MQKMLEKISCSIRSLSIDAIERAGSGHPGLPLGAAELGAALYTAILRHNPANPHWVDRDRFVLSAGHGSLLQYTMLHVCGYDVALDDLKNFRRFGSKCPGHPEYGHTAGIEATTGPLGQGIAMAVGMAAAEKMLAAAYNTEDYTIIDHYTYSFVGEGCLMEGVSSEASSYAGHMQLGKLIVYYDENRVTIDGTTDITFTEDIAKRYEAYGWQVLRGSMYSFDDIIGLTEKARGDSRPSLIMLRSKIGKFAGDLEGTSKVHGAKLGAENARVVKIALGLDPEQEFFVDKTVYDFFAQKRIEWQKQEDAWNAVFSQWRMRYPDKYTAWKNAFLPGGCNPAVVNACSSPEFVQGQSYATRAAGQRSLQVFADVLPNLVGGSADLSGSNGVALNNFPAFTVDCPSGRNIQFGIREFAMAAITNGLVLHGGLRSFCATFLVFSDYLRPALRLAALMKIPSLFVFSHDSIFVGEDGPTHQPVEHIAALRTIPGVYVLRPADAEEAMEAWRFALTVTDAPVCLIMSRQGLPLLDKHDLHWRQTIKQGAYVVRHGGADPDVTLLASGSEVSMAVRAAEQCPEKNIRIVSVLSKERFEQCSTEMQQAIIGKGEKTPRIITVEAGIRQGWEGFVENNQDTFSIERFGYPGSPSDVAEALSFTVDQLVQCICS